MRTGFSGDLIKRLLPTAKYTVAELEEKYPSRDLPEGAIVTRFAPSPTGYIHIGNILSSLLGRKLAQQSNGVWYLRIEDTDTEREVEGAVDLIIKSLATFGITADEGPVQGGNYGSYTQTERKEIYHSVAAGMLSRGIAYPCFLTEEEIDAIREIQEKSKMPTGIYGEFAKWRDADEADVIARLDAGEVPAFRFYNTGDPSKRIFCKDVARGSISYPENNEDIIILKSSNGFPTYHFGMMCDDHFMRTTHIIRGEEYLATFPLHVQMFNALGWALPQFIHNITLDKIDPETGNQRKLSKRKDPENGAAYYLENGWPAEAIQEYLFNILSSSYEEDKAKGKVKNIWDANINVKKLPTSGALFDWKKLEWWAREFIATLPAVELATRVRDWAAAYGNDFEKSQTADMDYLTKILSIERSDVKRARKDFYTYKQTLEEIAFFYSPPVEGCRADAAGRVIEKFLSSFNIKDDKDLWWKKITDIAADLGLKNGEIAMTLRVAVTGREQTPDLYSIMQVMGDIMVRERLAKCQK